MFHLFLTHSSIGGHLGCFHVLVTVNSAAVNISISILLNYGFLQIMPKGGIAWSMVGLFLVFFSSKDPLPNGSP